MHGVIKITARCSLRRPRRSLNAAEDGGLSETLRCDINLVALIVSRAVLGAGIGRR